MSIAKYSSLFIIVIGICISLSSASTLSIQNVTATNVGDSAQANIHLDQAPQGLSGYNITITVDNQNIGEIVGISFPSWASITDNSSIPANSIWIKGLDLSEQIQPGSINVSLGTLTLRGDQIGSSVIDITINQMDDFNGSVFSPTIQSGTFTVGSTQAPVANYTASPHSGTSPLQVQFNDTSTGTVPLSYQWNFGDGSGNSTIANPAHTFTTGTNQTFTVVLTVSNTAGSSSKSDLITVNVAPPTPPVFNFTLNLANGWNLFSTPITLDSNQTSVKSIFTDSNNQNISVIYGWNGAWFIPDDAYEIKPLDAFYIKVNGSVTAHLVPSPVTTQLPSRNLPGGASLIGPAPAYLDGDFQDMPLDQELTSISEGPGGITGYTMVISPELNQPGWGYALGGSIQNIMPFKGYWVVMDNPDTLFGFSTTPLIQPS
jgi:PKD repeat protein